MTKLVVDTSVLYKANDSTAGEHWDAVKLLTRLPGNASVYIDAEGEILAEYCSVFGPGIQSFAFLWWQKQLSVTNGVWTISGKLSGQQQKIFGEQGCDPSDISFIGVALREGIPVVHEDGDYEEPCAKALGVLSHRLAVACAVLGL